MGLFDFMKGAGDKGADELAAPVDVSTDRLNQLRQENISRNLAKLDVEGEQVSVEVDGEIARLSGTAPSQEALEKMVLCAGNQHGIGQVDCQLVVAADAQAAPASAPATASSGVTAPAGTPAAEQERAATFYTVQSGDTLGKIAADHYGDAGKYMVIFEANRPMLSDPDKIYPGQSLRIPVQ